MRTDDRRQWAAEIVRCHIDLVGVAHRGHADRFWHAVILRVDDRDVGAMRFEIGLERAPAQDRLE